MVAAAVVTAAVVAAGLGSVMAASVSAGEVGVGGTKRNDATARRPLRGCREGAWHGTERRATAASAARDMAWHMARPAPRASLSTEGDVVCRSRKRRQPMPRSGTSHIARPGWFEPNGMLRSSSRGAWGVRWSARRRCGWVGDRGYIGVRVGYEGQYPALSVENNGLVPEFKESTYAHDLGASQHKTGFIYGKNRENTNAEF